jgi:anti-sigma B factor antagonist
VALELDIVDSRGVKLVFCRGRLSMGPELENFKNKVSAFLADSPSVVLDFKHLEFIDSTGIGAIVSLQNKARAEGGDIKLASITSSHIRKVLQATKMTSVFQIFDDERQAASSFMKTGT